MFRVWVGRSKEPRPRSRIPGGNNIDPRCGGSACGLFFYFCSSAANPGMNHNS
ncbi:hypothetical protein HMPREF1986_00628 [Oribacterium sp. oral taxon 078 str. F0263]|nr:hypothetical protein HMPREF1986_00628 [Oribacterium sp. oral taxon 078 str. F0263]